jgi:hypothetical protein
VLPADKQHSSALLGEQLSAHGIFVPVHAGDYSRKAVLVLGTRQDVANIVDRERSALASDFTVNEKNHCRTVRTHAHRPG